MTSRLGATARLPGAAGHQNEADTRGASRYCCFVLGMAPKRVTLGASIVAYWCWTLRALSSRKVFCCTCRSIFGGVFALLIPRSRCHLG